MIADTGVGKVCETAARPAKKCRDRSCFSRLDDSAAAPAGLQVIAMDQDPPALPAAHQRLAAQDLDVALRRDPHPAARATLSRHHHHGRAVSRGEFFVTNQDLRVDFLADFPPARQQLFDGFLHQAAARFDAALLFRDALEEARHIPLSICEFSPRRLEGLHGLEDAGLRGGDALTRPLHLVQKRRVFLVVLDLVLLGLELLEQRLLVPRQTFLTPLLLFDLGHALAGRCQASLGAAATLRTDFQAGGKLHLLGLQSA